MHTSCTCESILYKNQNVICSRMISQLCTSMCSGGSRGGSRGAKEPPFSAASLVHRVEAAVAHCVVKYCACCKMCSRRRASLMLDVAVARHQPAQCRNYVEELYRRCRRCRRLCFDWRVQGGARVFALSIALIVIGERSEQTTTRRVESSLLHATVASDSLASQTG